MKIMNLKLLESDDELSIEELATRISKECTVALDLFKRSKRMFYRGTMPKTARIQVRQDRKPRDSNQYAHELYNRIMSKFGGHESWRSSSVFVTTNQATAIGYGVPHVMIPIGDFEMLYSQQLHDPYDMLDAGNAGGRGLWKLISALDTPLESEINNMVLGSTIVDDIKRICVEAISAVKSDLLSDYPDCSEFLTEKFVADRFDTVTATSDVKRRLLLQLLQICTDAAQDANEYRDFADFLSSTGSANHAIVQVLEKIFEPVKSNKKLDEFYKTLYDEIERQLCTSGLCYRVYTSAKLTTSLSVVTTLYEQIMTNVLQAVYQYVPKASQLPSIPKLGAAEIMIRCKEYYILGQGTFLAVKRAIEKMEKA